MRTEGKVINVGDTFGCYTVFADMSIGRGSKRLRKGYVCKCNKCGSASWVRADAIAQRNYDGCSECYRNACKPGKKFGRLTVLEHHDSTHVICRCDCGKLKTQTATRLLYSHPRGCGCMVKTFQARGINNPEWKGGRSLTTHGYVVVHAPGHWHANKGYGHKYALEHHKVMADYLGRPLDTKRESVHHKNGDRTDNRIENLELRTRYHGSGQSIEDKVKFCKEYISQYEPELIKLQLARDVRVYALSDYASN